MSKKAASKPSSESDGGRSPRKLRRFETALEEIEQILGQLESGRLGLSESLQQYQRGIETLKECHELLAEAERRITLLSGFDAEGNPVTVPLEDSQATLDEKQSRRAARRGVASAEAGSQSPLSEKTSDSAGEELF